MPEDIIALHCMLSVGASLKLARNAIAKESSMSGASPSRESASGEMKQPSQSQQAD